MNRLVLTEKFIDHYFNPTVKNESRIIKTKTRKPSKSILDRNGIEEQEKPDKLKVPSSSVFVRKNNQLLTNINSQLRDSLGSSLHNFMHMYDLNHKAVKNSKLSNYKLHSSLKKLPKMEKYVLSKLRPLAQKAKNLRNRMMMVSSKHAQKEKNFNSLSRKVKRVYNKKKMQFYKELDEFIPSTCDYAKEYLFPPAPPKIEKKASTKLEPFRKATESSEDSKRSRFIFESQQTLMTIQSRNTKFFESSAKSRMNIDIKSSFNCFK